jgi:hypothetical protein
LRIDEQLRRQLEAAAKEHHVTFAQEARLRLTKSTQSLAGYVADFERNARDIIEHDARNSKGGNNATWERLAQLGAKLRGTYTDIEILLLPHMHLPELRALMRGAQQEQGKGGKS